MNIPTYPPHDPRYKAEPLYKPKEEKSSLKARVPGLVEQAKGRKWLIVGGAALVAVLAGFYYYSGNGTTGGAGGGRGGRGGAAAPVRVTTVVQRDMPVVERTIGTVVAFSTVSVTSRVQGQLNEANFREGQLVKKGDLLFTLDKRPFQAALAQARGTLARDKAQAADAQRNKARYASLVEQGATSTQQRDTAAATADATAATVEADSAAAQTAELNLSFAEIRSPIDGKTGPILIQPGNVVPANGANPLVVIAQIQPIKVSFALPQSDLPRIQARQRSAGLTATVDLRNVGGQTISAPVDFISNAVSATSGTIELRSTFENADSSLVPGQLVDVVVEMNNIPNATIVPREAINDGPDGQYVYLVEDGRAQQHNIKVLFDDGTNVAIESDLKAGDQVISEGQLRVLPGGQVNVLAARGATGAAAGTQAGGRAGRGAGRRGGGGRRGQGAGAAGGQGGGAGNRGGQ